MPDIIKYNILNPVTDKKKPFIRDGVLYFPIKERYNYFVECYTDNIVGGSNYYILLGKEKFNPNCRKCQMDGYGRCKIKLKGDIKDYVEYLCKTTGNVELEYIESSEEYDVFSII